jgi:hypothetical protein
MDLKQKTITNIVKIVLAQTNMKFMSPSPSNPTGRKVKLQYTSFRFSERAVTCAAMIDNSWLDGSSASIYEKHNKERHILHHFARLPQILLATLH